MLGYGVADSAQLDLLSRVVADHCAKYGISGPDDREDIARKVLNLYSSGILDAISILSELERVR